MPQISDIVRIFRSDPTPMVGTIAALFDSLRGELMGNHNEPGIC